MGGGGKNGASDAAKQQRRDEEARQRRIREGMARIDDVFDGGWTVSGRLNETAQFDPDETYYLSDGTEWTLPQTRPTAAGSERRGMPGYAGQLTNFLLREGGAGGVPTSRDPADSEQRGMPGFGGQLTNYLIGGGRRGTGSRAPRTLAEALQQGLYSGREERQGFNDQFFDGIRDDYLAFARPQLDDQFSDAREQQTFNLARAGLLDSSVRGEKAADLQKEYDTNLTQLRSTAVDRAGQARSRVEDARSDLVRTLQATGDADAAANSALARADALSTPDAYSPVGQLFQDTSAILSSQIAQERAEASRNYYRNNLGLGTQLFGASPNAVRTRG